MSLTVRERGRLTSMRTKLNDLLIYHSTLDSPDIIALLQAFEIGSTKHIEYIVEHVTKSNVNKSIGVFGYLPLELAIIYDRRDLFDYFIDHLDAKCNILNKSLYSLVFVALEFQSHGLLHKLLEHDMCLLYDFTPENNQTLMHQAAMRGDDATVDSQNRTPLSYACHYGHVRIVELLLNASDESLMSLEYGIAEYEAKCNKVDDEEDDDEIFGEMSMLAPSPIRFEDDSLAMCLMFKHLECARLILTRTLDYSPIVESSVLGDLGISCAKYENGELVTHSVLDIWFVACVKITTNGELELMTNLFHEIVLNDAKFTLGLLKLVDWLQSQISTFIFHYPIHSQFNQDFNDHDARINETNSPNLFYFWRLVGFLFGYGKFEQLFPNECHCQLFLRYMLAMLGDFFVVHLKKLSSNTQKSTSRSTNENQSISLLLNEYKNLMQSLYSSGLSLKYLTDVMKPASSHVRNKSTSSIDTNNNYESAFVISQDDCDEVRKCQAFCARFQNRYLFTYSSNAKQLKYFDNESDDLIQSTMQPLRLLDMCSIQIKKSLFFYDIESIEKLNIPRDLKRRLASTMVPGLGQSYQRHQRLISSN